MKTHARIARLLLVAALLPLLGATAGLAHPHILRAADRSEVTPEEMLHDLKKARVIFIGELHDRTGHHRAQMSILRALARDAVPLAIGLEMFRRDGQDDLDLWIDGTYPLDSFLRVYNDHWSMWEQYRDIFTFARSSKVPLVGLNIPRDISNRVARHGFAALPERDRQALGNVQCRVDPAYGEFIRRAMGGYGGHAQQYLFFCEAQLLWDTMMARHLGDFLKENPRHRVVVLAGSGHAWKFGIPRQLLEQMSVSYRVVLPEIAGRVERGRVTAEITDYLWLDEGEDGWSF